jgi:creatinine amidohydrolase
MRRLRCAIVSQIARECNAERPRASTNQSRVVREVEMSGTSVLWGEHTAEELAAAARSGALVILPCGCTEQHAYHLPVDTDTYQVERLAREGADLARERYGLRVLVLPALPFGPASEHYGLAGTISLPNEVWIAVVKAVVWSALDSGFRHIAALRGCGGHWALPGALWDVKAEAHRARRDVTLRLLDVAADWQTVQAELFPGAAGGHAAVMETALCLADRPHLVRQDRMVAPQVDRLRERYIEGGEVFLFDELTDTGALGDPRPATATAGKAAWAAIVARFAERLQQITEPNGAAGSP